MIDFHSADNRQISIKNEKTTLSFSANCIQIEFSHRVQWTPASAQACDATPDPLDRIGSSAPCVPGARANRA